MNDLFSTIETEEETEFREYCQTEMGKAAIDYDNANPIVYRLFMSYAQQVMKSGRDKYSAQAIFERIRWHMDLETDGDEFKINNNYRPYFARKLMAEYPEFKGFFALRSSQT